MQDRPGLSRGPGLSRVRTSPNERASNDDLTEPLPARAPDAELFFYYDAGGNRVLKTSVDAQSVTRHTVYITGSFELRGAAWNGTDYTLDVTTASLHLPVGPIGARIVIAQPDLPSITTSHRHIFLELADQLGSGAITIDHATGELVERTTYEPYGATESDYRPGRWASFREPYKFTGKEEDIEVGLQYFGARYYSPYLSTWISADPATIHELQGDANPYAYVQGRALVAVDPDGRNPLVVALIAAIVAAAVNTGVQLANNGGDFGKVNWGWKGVAGAAVIGAISGGVGAGVGAGIAATSGSGAFGGLAGGAYGGTVGYFAGAAIGAYQPTVAGYASSMIGGALGGATGGALGPGFGSSLAAAGTGGTASFLTGAAITGHASFDEFALSIGAGVAAAVASYGLSELAEGKHSQPGQEDRSKSHKGIQRGDIDPREPIAEPKVRAKISQAWDRSDPDGASPHEYGGVALHDKDGARQVGMFTNDKPNTVDIDSRVRELPRTAQQRVDATFHTHPNPSSPSYNDAPSNADQNWFGDPNTPAAIRNNPHYVIAHDGVYRMTYLNQRIDIRYLGTRLDVLGHQ
jgi:RHS repeat-associated protein